MNQLFGLQHRGGQTPCEQTPCEHARFGDGIYFTDLESSQYTRGQLSYKLYSVPYNYRKLTYYMKINVNGLNIIQNSQHNFSIPGKNVLPLQGRILDRDSRQILRNFITN